MLLCAPVFGFQKRNSHIWGYDFMKNIFGSKNAVMTNYFLFESNEAKNFQNQNILTKQKLFMILNINNVMYF